MRRRSPKRIERPEQQRLDGLADHADRAARANFAFAEGAPLSKLQSCAMKKSESVPVTVVL